MIRRVLGILTCVAVICGGAVVLESRAADHGNLVVASQPPGGPAQRAKSALTNSPAPTTPARPAPTKTAGANPPAAKPPAPGAPQVPEESATIRDDPTIVPDPKQSADNNVSFPSDI